MSNQYDKPRLSNITFENARLVFTNFEGKGDNFNPKGVRNFCVLLDDDVANELKAQGYNVRYLAAREPGDADQAYMQVKVSYDNYPPKVVLVSPSTGKQTILTEDTISILDWTEMANVDFMTSPYEWEINGKTGVKPYLKKMFVTIVEDQLELKYGSIASSPEDAQPSFDDED